MYDCIYREAAIEAVCKDCNEVFPDQPCEPADCELMQALRSIPAADVRPDVTAEWIEEDDGYGFYYSCSACGAAVCTADGDPVDIGWSYCPECGARMIGIRRLPKEEMED